MMQVSSCGLSRLRLDSAPSAGPGISPRHHLLDLCGFLLFGVQAISGAPILPGLWQAWRGKRESFSLLARSHISYSLYFITLSDTILYYTTFCMVEMRPGLPCSEVWLLAEAARSISAMVGILGYLFWESLQSGYWLIITMPGSSYLSFEALKAELSSRQ